MPWNKNNSAFTLKPYQTGENKGHIPLSQPICNYCKQQGPIVSDCISLQKRKREKSDLNLQVSLHCGQNLSYWQSL